MRAWGDGTPVAARVKRVRMPKLRAGQLSTRLFDSGASGGPSTAHAIARGFGTAQGQVRGHRLRAARWREQRLADVRLHIATALSQDQLVRIRAVSPRLQVTYHPYIVQETPRDLPDRLADVEVLLTYHAR